MAAGIVVLYHLSLVAQPYLDTGQVGDAWWWISATPLKIMTAGSEGVLVFFVLSGLVVALPSLQNSFAWRGYYLTRLLRLYVPVWVALAIAATLVVLLPRDPSMVTAGSWVATTNATTTSVAKWLSDASLTRAGYDLDNVLWSLRWEVVFSVTLPLFVAVALLLRRAWLVGMATALGISIFGTVVGSDPVTYLPLFLVGTIAALHLDEIQSWARCRGPASWRAISIAAISLSLCNPILTRLLPAGGLVALIETGAAGAGASGVVLCALCSPAWRRALSTRVPGFLGRISFSLYLVHVPIIATVSYLVGDRLWWLVALISIPISVVAGWLFHRAVERPSHRLAKAAGAERGIVLSGGTS